MKPDLIVILGPAPYAPDVTMDRILDAIEGNGGKLGWWYTEVKRDPYESGASDFSVIHEADDLSGRDDLRDRIRRNGSGWASFWSGQMMSGDEHVMVFEDPSPELPDDLDPVEHDLLRAMGERDAAARAVYADWLERAGALERAEFLRLQHAAAVHPPASANAQAEHASRSARLRELARTIDVGWLAQIHANTTTVFHLAASTSSPWSSGVARFVSLEPEFDDFRIETLAYFEAIATAVDVTHFIAGEYMFHWELFDAERFRAGPSEHLQPRHVAWRRDTFTLAEAGVWGTFTPGMVRHGPQFDHAQTW